MRLSKIIAFLLLGLLFASPGWANHDNWAIFVPTTEQYTGSSGNDSFGDYWGWAYDLTGVDHIQWFSCWLGFACTYDSSAFNYYDVLGDYYDCDGNLLESGAVFSGGWGLIRDTGTVLSGGIGGHGSNPVCVVYQGEAPARRCRVYFDMTPVKRMYWTCNPWPLVPPPNPDKDVGHPRCELSVGDNINAATGNKYEEGSDLSVSKSGGISLELRRS